MGFTHDDNDYNEILRAQEPEIMEEPTEDLDVVWAKIVNRVQTHIQWAGGCEVRTEAQKRWRDAKYFYTARQWDGILSFGIPGRKPERKRMKPNPVDNFVKAQVEGLVGDICDAPADIQIKPVGREDENSADLYDKACKHIWYVNKGDRKLEFAVRRGVMYGPLVAKVFFDADWVGGRLHPFVGEVCFINVPLDNILFDPRIRATEPGVIQQSGFVIYRVKRPLTYIRERYPETGNLVTADSYADYIAVIDTISDDYSMPSEDMSAMVYEYWYRGEPLGPKFPGTLDYSPFVDDNGDGVHCAVISNGILLEHKPYMYPKYPFAVEWMYPSDDSPYGYGDVHDMLLPQLIMNKLNELAVEGNTVAAMGNWITDEGNIRNVAQFQKYAQTGGSVLPVVDSSRIKRELGGGVPNSVFNHYAQEQRAMETVSGRVDVTQGRSPRGVRAASAISLLLQQAAGRVRQRSRAVSSFVEQIVDLFVLNIGQFYTEDKFVRVVGADGKIDWTELKRDQLIRTITYNTEDGQQVTEEVVPDFDIQVVVGTDTPTSKAYYAELAQQLYQAQVIDSQALLETLQFPRWREIRARMEQQQAQQVQQPQQPQQQVQEQPQQEIPPEVLQQLQAQQQGEGGNNQGGENELAMLQKLVANLQRNPNQFL